jgi:hypothetical protein
MSFLSKIFAGLTPPPVVVSEGYDGLEWRWKMFTFRPACMCYVGLPVSVLTAFYVDFVNEVFLIGAMVLYVAFWWYGSSKNKRLANKWCIMPIFSTPYLTD